MTMLSIFEHCRVPHNFQLELSLKFSWVKLGRLEAWMSSVMFLKNVRWFLRRWSYWPSCYLPCADANHEAATEAIENMADAVTHARFVGTDPASDEVVLMKILQVNVHQTIINQTSSRPPSQMSPFSQFTVVHILDTALYGEWVVIYIYI
jgi:hypothetical protein